MNVVKCISGLEGEDQIATLVEEIVNFSVLDNDKSLTLICCDESINVGKLVCKAQEKVLEELLASKTVLRSHAHIDIFKKGICSLHAKTILDLKDSMGRAARVGGGEIIIIEPKVLDVNFEVTVQEFVDTYPNADCDSSINIYWSRKRI